MSTKTHDQSERLHELGRDIQTKRGQLSTIVFEADGLVAEYKANGTDVLKDKKAFAKVDAAYAPVDALRAEIEKLEVERGKLVDAIAGARRNGIALAGQVFDDGAVLGAAPWTLSSEGLDELHAAWEAGRFGRTGIHAEATWADPTSIERTSILVGLAQEPTRIADLIPIRTTTSMRVEYFKQTGRADNAEAVAAGATKPESSPSWDRFYADVVKVAHRGKIQDEVLKDLPSWRSIVGGAYVRGLISEENRQILVADGTGEDMFGLRNTDGILNIFRDVTTPEPRLETIHRAITRLRTGDAKCDPSVIILNPVDYEQALFEKASGSGEYLAGNPLGMDTPSLWNVPVALTTDMTEGTGIVANLPLAARLHWRETPIFEVHPGGGGEAEWIANMTLVRAEERFVLTVERPEAICEVDLI
jgi:HK97 family phage major capsid protein